MALNRVRAMGTSPGGFTVSYKNRALELLNDPDALNQGSYGTCGMAAAVRALLIEEPLKFVRLLDAIFRRSAFNGTVIPEKLGTGKSVLLHQRQKMIQNKVQVSPNYDADYDLDFICSRSLAKILKMKDQTLYDRLKVLGESFVANFNVKGTPADIARDKGDLALDAQALRFLMSDVLQVSDVRSSSRPGDVQDDVDVRVASVNEMFTFEKRQKRSFVFAGINGTDNFQDVAGGGVLGNRLGAPTLMAVPPGQTRPKFEHIIVITGQIVSNANTYTVPVWTWSFSFNVVVPKQYMSDYFPVFVLGTFRD